MSQYRQANTTAPGAALAHTIYGEPVTASLKPESTGDNVAQSTQSFMRPYQPPKRRQGDNPDRELCAHEGCKAYPRAGKSYCPGHGRMHGESPVCQHRDCNAPPKKGTHYCRWHSGVSVEELENEPD